MNEIQSLLEKHPSFRQQLFRFGYILTDDTLPSLDDYPFYGNYKEYHFSRFTLRVHLDQHCATTQTEDSFFILIGNAVNPYDGEISEQTIVEKLAEQGQFGSPDSISYLNELTGNFLALQIRGNTLHFITDPAGMLFGCYGQIGGKLYVSSHPQMIADLIPLSKSTYIKKLEKYRFFYKYGLFFPGDLTQYQELKRFLQNHITSFDGKQFTVRRFYPVEELHSVADDVAYKALLADVTQTLHNTLSCYAKKYSVLAISLTGGMDSKTTLACSRGLEQRFRYYSYITMPGDKIDADAVHKIAEHLSISHQVYHVSDKDSDFPNIEVARAILEHNNGGYRVNDNDVRKRAFFQTLCRSSEGFDAEVKSWVSEIARANYYKKFGLKKLPRHLSPRNMASMYKVFLWQRLLAKQTARIFAEFINKTGFHELPDGYDESDFYLWEFRYSAWGGIVITSEHSYSNEILIPYNNRRLLGRMLQAPIKKRISDQFHKDLILAANPQVEEPGITITNWNETPSRMRIERLYFLINSHLPL